MKSKKTCLLFFLFALTIFSVANVSAAPPAFTDTFFEDQCKFTSKGSNPYFILQPGHELLLEGDDEGDLVRLVITVLDRTKVIDGVETRVVRERETQNGELLEVSDNYFAICKQTNSVFYFGEDVDFYKDGQVINHDGSWRAGVNGARPGIIMPGTLLLGSRYFQEIAPDVALDRAEIRKLDAVVSTPFGNFENCLLTRETTPLEPDALEFKRYAPGVGLIKDGPLELISFSTADATFYSPN